MRTTVPHSPTPRIDRTARRLSDIVHRDVRLAWRRIRSAPAPALFAVVTLALGIGVTVATFSIVYTALWRPLYIPDEARVVLVGRNNSMRPGSTTVSWPDYERISSFFGTSSVAAWTSFDNVIAGANTAEMARIEAVTGSYFSMLGIHAHYGRLLAPDDDVPGGPGRVVLAHRTWREQFAGDPAIIGTTVTIAGSGFEVVGITTEGFRGAHPNGFDARDAWISRAAANRLVMSMARAFGPDNSVRALTVGLRLPAEVTRQVAGQHLHALGRELDVSAPLPSLNAPEAPRLAAYRAWSLESISEDQLVNAQDALGRMTVALPTLVLLIACTNIGNLVLSRGVARRNEFAVRTALGASRARLVVEQMIEQSLIVAVGGSAGVLVAYGLVRAAAHAAQANLAPFMRGAYLDWTMDARVLALALGGAVLAIMVAGLAPAIHLTRGGLRAALSDGNTGSTPRWRGRANLIALQVGISVGLFLIAMVFAQHTVGAIPQGQHAEGSRHRAQVAVAVIPFALQGHDADAQRVRIDRIRSRAAANGIDTIATMSRQPFGKVTAGTPINARIAGVLPQPALPPVTLKVVAVSPEAFGILDVTLRSGRVFDERDVREAQPVALIDEDTARAVFGNQDAPERELRIELWNAQTQEALGTRVVTVVGIEAAGTVPSATLYLPFAQQPVGEVVFLAASAGAAPVVQLRDVIRQADPQLAVSMVTTNGVLEHGPLAFTQHIAAALLGLALLALGLAATGLYGVLSHVVTRRTREMGIRMALGATRHRIIALVLRGGFRPIVEGLFIGLATAVVIRLFLQTAMPSEDIAAIDPVTCLASALLVLLAGGLACYLPARRAASVDPNVALRSI